VRSPALSLVAFLLLGLGILGFPGLYYACMTALVPEERLGAATAVGQLILNVGGLVAPPAFGYLVDVASYRASWSALAGATVAAVALLVGLYRTV
jgi:MFS family permease